MKSAIMLWFRHSTEDVLRRLDHEKAELCHYVELCTGLRQHFTNSKIAYLKELARLREQVRRVKKHLVNPELLNFDTSGPVLMFDPASYGMPIEEKEVIKLG